MTFVDSKSLREYDACHLESKGVNDNEPTNA